MGIVLENKQKHSVMFGKTEQFPQIVLQGGQKHSTVFAGPNTSRKLFSVLYAGQ